LELSTDVPGITGIKSTVFPELWYLTVGKTPLERVYKLLSKLDSIRRSKKRGSVVLEADKGLSNKYVGQVESILKNLPKSLKWQSFLMHNLILLIDIPLNAQKASVKAVFQTFPSPNI